MSSLPKDVHGSGILGTTAGEEVGLCGLPDRSSVVQLLEFGQSPCTSNLSCSVRKFPHWPPIMDIPCWLITQPVAVACAVVDALLEAAWMSMLAQPASAAAAAAAAAAQSGCLDNKTSMNASQLMLG